MASTIKGDTFNIPSIHVELYHRHHHHGFYYRRWYVQYTFHRYWSTPLTSPSWLLPFTGDTYNTPSIDIIYTLDINIMVSTITGGMFQIPSIQVDLHHWHHHHGFYYHRWYIQYTFYRSNQYSWHQHHGFYHHRWHVHSTFHRISTHITALPISFFPGNLAVKH